MKKLPIILALLLLAACAGGGSEATTTVAPAPTTTAAAPTSTGAASSDGPTIEIRGFSFGDPITVSVGQEVTVVNRDAIPHTWTSSDGLFDSGSLGAGDEFAFTFAEAGEYEFFCGIHPDMKGSITVEG